MVGTKSKKDEVEFVAKRVETTKKEIDQLKADLQKLISTGISNAASRYINTSRNSTTITEKPKPPSSNKLLSDSEFCPTIKSSSELKIVPKTCNSSKIVLSEDFSKQIDAKSVDERSKSLQKLSSYDREKAREYIRKQREKRKEQAKNQALDSKVAADIKRKKLIELHRKSKELLHKNVEHKRRRSKSRENGQNTVGNEQNCGSESKVVSKFESHCVVAPLPLNKGKFSHITVRQKQIQCEDSKSRITPEALVRAAIKIQSYYRGYRQRKSYKILLLKRRLQLEAKKQDIGPQKVTSQTQTNIKEIQSKQLPSWFQSSDPYSFINTVKRKLHLAVHNESPVTKTDVAVQSIPNKSEPEVPLESKRDSVSLNCEKVKSLTLKTNKDLKSFLSHKCMNSDVPVPDVVSPKIARKSVSLKKAPSHKSVKNDDPSSDSDTSKNIPNISSESSQTSLDQKVVKNDSAETDAECRSESEYSDFKLPINTEKLSKLRLRRRPLNYGENTFQYISEKKNTDDLKSRSNSATKLLDPVTITSNSISTEKSNSIKSVIEKTQLKSESLDDLNKSSRTKLNEFPVFSKSDIIAYNVSKYNKSPNCISDNDKCHTKSATNEKVEAVEELDSFQKYFKELDQSSTVGEIEEKVEEANVIDSDRSPEEDSENKKAIDSDERKSDRNDSVKKSSASEEIKTDSETIKSHHQSVHCDTKNNEDKYSDSFTKPSTLSQGSSVIPLQKPSVSLHSMHQDKAVKNILIKTNGGQDSADVKTNSSNQIHLKIEAELHLLNDFNNSLGKFVALEKSILEMQGKNEKNALLQTKDTQTSLIAKTQTFQNNSEIVDKSKDSRQMQLKNLNFSRGSDVTDNISLFSLNENRFEPDGDVNTNIESFNNSIVSSINESVVEQQVKNPYYGVSLGMFEQLIKDEDARLQNLKTILKIREKALLDRTKGELAWLEIQKKHLKETGRLHEVSLVKKKQRGILLRLQQEQHEMQKLKHMQKTASKERKTLLREQRNMIKAQLSTNSMLTKVKVTATTRDSGQHHRNSGPFKAYNIRSRSESIRSETSVSRRSVTEEVLSVTSRSCSVRCGTDGETETDVERRRAERKADGKSNKLDHVKRTLLMREVALQKRRKAAEDLLQWHKKLVEEEKRVAELEAIAKTVISEVAKEENITERRPTDVDAYSLSQLALQHFCKDAEKYVGKYAGDEMVFGKINEEISDKSGERHFDASQAHVYSSDFESSVTLNNVDVQTEASPTEKTSKNNDKISSISELIDNLTKINDEISLLSKRSSLNKSIDSELDNLSNNSMNVSANSKSELWSKGSKIEINKLLVLKENLTLDNNNAILDSIQSLKSSIQKITSKADSRHKSFSISKEENEESKTINEDLLDVLSSKSSNEPVCLEKDESQSDSVSTIKESVVSKLAENSSKLEKVLDSSSEAKTDSKQVTENEEISEEVPKILTLTSKEETVTSNGKRKDTASVQELTHEDITTLTENKQEICSIEEESGVTKNKSPESFEEEKFDTSELISERKEEIEELVSEQIKAEDEEINLSGLQENIVVSVTSLDEINSDELTSEEDGISSAATLLNEEVNAEILESSPATHSQLEVKINNEENIKDSELEVKDEIESTQEAITNSEAEIIADEEVFPKNKSETAEELDEKPESYTNEASAKSRVETEEDNSLEISSQYSKTVCESHTTEDAKTDLDLSYGKIINNSKPSSVSDSEEITEKVEDEVNADDVYIDDDISVEKSYVSSKEESIKTPTKEVDVKKRVSEILADANVYKNESSPRVQDLYTTTYDVISPEVSPRSGSPSNEVINIASVKRDLGTEAEELLRKQIAIEQEIKRLEQQQKEHIPYIFMRQIPNKPPPPYTPPVSIAPLPPPTVIPASIEQTELITSNASKILYEAHLKGTLEEVKLSNEITESLCRKNVDKSCIQFVFDVCKELATEYYSQFEEDKEPSWMRLTRKPRLCSDKFADRKGLEEYLGKKVGQLLGFEKVEIRESSVIRWSRKKRDHVDEILVMESQAEEVEWTNYERDELFVKNEVTNEILNMLLSDTADVLSQVFKRKIVSE